MGKYSATEMADLLHSIKPKIRGLRDQLDDYEAASKVFVKMDSFEGDGADYAKDYYKTAQIPATKALNHLARDIEKTGIKIKNDFEDNVDSSPDALYDSDFLEDYLSDGKKAKQTLLNTIDEINEIIADSGSTTAEKLKTSQVKDHFKDWQTDVADAKDKFDDFRNEHTNAWGHIDDQLDNFQVVLNGFKYSQEHGGVTSYSGKTKAMLQTAITKTKSVSQLEKETGLKKPKGMSENRYKQLVSQIPEQVKALEKAYGMDSQTAKQLVQYNWQFDQYAKKERWSKKEAAYQYARIMASLVGYTNTQWKLAGGTVDQEDAKSILSKIGLSKVSIKEFLEKVNKIHESSSLSNNDFGHTMGSMAVILNTNQTSDKVMKILTSGSGTLGLSEISNPIGQIVTLYSSLQNGDNKAAAATFRGDIASGSLDKKDMRADIDALNLAERISKGNSMTQALNNYSKDLSNHGNRISELERSIGDGDEKRGEKRLKQQIYAAITDLGDLAQEKGGNGIFGTNLFSTKDDADKFWGLLQKEKAGELK